MTLLVAIVSAIGVFFAMELTLSVPLLPLCQHRTLVGKKLSQ